MKWFKHYTDASRSEKLATLREKTGLEGYARYWLLVELLSEKFDGSNTTFRINKRTLGIHLGYYRHTMAEQWLYIGKTLGLYNFHCESDVYVIVFDKLLEIKDNHTKNLQVSGNKVSPRKDKEKNKNKNKIRNTMPSTDVDGLSDDDLMLNVRRFKKQSENEKDVAKLVRENYIQAYENRYGVKPTWAAKENKLNQTLIQRAGQEEAIWLSENYLNYHDPWHIQQKHPFALLITQLDKIRVELKNPNRMLDSQIAKKQIQTQSEKTQEISSREKLIQEFLNQPEKINHDEE